ncbi:NUDIX domain-containing protein [Candidatus Saccharibacteria bacterium]|nr:NUDIX domain-containing protein [Candidatus Saccharibacteria bacterium]
MNKSKKVKVAVAEEKVDLRRGIDHIGVTVNFLIHDGSGKILLQKRSKNCRDEHGKWDIGGGAVEFGEELHEALERELMEEYKISPLAYELTEIYNALREHQGIPTHWVAINYKVLVNPDEIRIGEPHKVDAIGWFNEDDLPESSELHSKFDEAKRIALKHNILK